MDHLNTIASLENWGDKNNFLCGDSIKIHMINSEICTPINSKDKKEIVDKLNIELVESFQDNFLLLLHNNIE